MTGVRVRTAASLAVAQLRYFRGRTVLAILGVALAVLTTVLLVALGTGVLSAGSAGLESIGADVWLTAGSVSFAPGVEGGVETDLYDSHRLADQIERRDDVTAARAIHFQTVYVGTEPGEYRTQVGTGVTGDGSSFNVETGRTFTDGDAHYANGSYDGPMSGEVLVDSATAETLNVTVGDRIHVGGTLTAASQNTFRIVGITNDVNRYVGAPSVVLHLAELQTVSRTTRQDPATAIIIAVAEDADPATVQADLARAYPDFEVRTASEQFSAILQRQSLVIGSAAAIGALAVVVGIAIVANIFGLLIYQQRRQLAAVRASGVSTTTLLITVFVQGFLVGVTGGAIGVALSLPGAVAINHVIELLVGFEELIALSGRLLGTALLVSLILGLFGAVIAGWRLSGVDPRLHL